MPVYRDFEDLPIWKESRDLTVGIYKLTNEGKLAKDWCLTNQIRSASLSISSNIAEGFDRSSRKEFIRFLYIAKGSVSEVRSQILVCIELGYVEKNESKILLDRTKSLAKQIGALISFLKKKNI
jgi:four helix bundle protein